MGHRNIHPTFHWIWKFKCQMKHKVFFWLLLKDRVSTRDLLRIRNMELDSCTCELCILQRQETLSHLFLRYNFAKACWQSIGVSVITTRPMLQIFRQIKEKIQRPFFMGIIILMSWCIWTTRTDWMFSNLHPYINTCIRKFMTEFSLVIPQRCLPGLILWIPFNLWLWFRFSFAFLFCFGLPSLLVFPFSFSWFLNSSFGL